MLTNWEREGDTQLANMCMKNLTNHCGYSQLSSCFAASDPTVVVRSDPATPVRPVGSDVTLTCTVDLDPAVDVPVTVTTVWTGPAGFMNTTTAQPVVGSTTTYTSTAMVSSFGRDQSGNYTCMATVRPTTLFTTDSDLKSETARVTVGKACMYYVIMGENIECHVQNVHCMSCGKLHAKNLNVDQ